MGSPVMNTVKRLLFNGLSEGTHRLYQSAFTLFEHFLQTNQIIVRRINTLPIVDVNIVISFVAFCFDKGLTHNTIKQYLTGIKHFYVIKDMTTFFPDMEGSGKLKLVLRGVKRLQKHVKRTRLPITYKILQSMVNLLLQTRTTMYGNLLLSVACTMAFFGFLRCGEFTSRRKTFDKSYDLCMADITLASDNSKFSIHLKHSKSDQSNAGVSIPIFANGTAICPVMLMRRFYNLRLQSGATQTDPLFLLPNGDILSRQYFIAEMRHVLRLLNFNDVNFNGHSLRRGACCEGHSAKLSTCTLQTLGRWSSEAWKVYVDVDESMIRKAQIALSAADKER